MKPRYDPKPCPCCGAIPEKAWYVEDDLLLQTPRSVWDMYKENGYTIVEAMREERSYE